LHNSDAIRLISSGSNICSSSHGILVAYKNEHIHQYSALPTNTQFTERGVKEYGFVSLGRRCEHNRSILAIARGRILPEALLKGQDILESKKEAGAVTPQLQGKNRTKVIFNEVINHQKKIKAVKGEHEDNTNYKLKRKGISLSLTNPDNQLKKKIIDKNITHIISKYNSNPLPIYMSDELANLSYHFSYSRFKYNSTHFE